MSDAGMSDTPAPATAPKPRQVNHTPWYAYVALLPMTLLVRLWLMSLRMDGDMKGADMIGKEREPLITCLWHNRLIIAAELRRRYRHHRPMNGLVSASKDGAWLAAFFNLMGIGAVRGSSSWRGGRALVELEDKLLEMEDIAITPDGPRGPMYDFKLGPAALALRTKSPILLIGAGFVSAKRLKSWDKFYIPLPFSKVKLTAEMIYADRYVDMNDRQLAEFLSSRLAALNETAEAAAAK